MAAHINKLGVTDKNKVSWLKHSGSMANAIRSSVWSNSSLGPIENWPLTLRSFVQMILCNAIPMAILWGEEFIFLCNDAYHAVFGTHDPGMMPQSIMDLWPDTKSNVWSIFKSILSYNKSYHFENLKFQIQKKDEAKNLYFNISCSPIEVEGGKTGGIFIVFQETSRAFEAEKRLRESQELLKMIIDCIPADIFALDLKQRFTLINDTLAKLYDMPKENVIGKTPYDIFTYEVAEKIKADNERILRTGIPLNLEEIIIDKKKKMPRVMMTSKFPLRDASGNIVGIGGVANDITARKKAEESIRQSEAIYRAIGESLNYGIWICNAEGKNIYASRSLLNLIGMSQEQCSNYGWLDKIHPDDAMSTKEAWENCVRVGQFWEWEHRFKGVDGQWHPILARGVPIRNEQGNIVYWAGINLDISQMKSVEEKLKKALAARDEFLSIASHELKTPLTALYLQIQLLVQIVHQQPLKNNAYLVKLSSGAFHLCENLVHQVEQLMDITRIRVGKLYINRQKIDLKEIIRESILDISQEAQRSGSQILFKGSQSIIGWWDPTRMKQILNNMLSNAIKYGNGKPIVVNLTLDKLKNCVKILVQDQGLGIPPEMHNKIFERFERAVVGNKISGLGLGLYIVRQLVEAHEGSIHVMSEPGKGALFTVELPIGEKA